MQFEALLPCDEAAGAVGRRSLELSLPVLVPPERLERLRLATSELISNAVRHSGCHASDDLRLMVEVHDDAVRVEVEQPTSAVGAVIPDIPRDPPEGGFGLAIVNALSERWGVTPGLPGGVWFEMSLGG